MIEYSIGHRIVLIRFRGKIDDAQLTDVYTRLYTDPDWVPGFSELVDVRGAIADGVTSSGLKTVAEITRRAMGPNPSSSKTAILTSKDVGLGLARMYEAFSADSSEHVRVFNGEVEKALEWLGAPPEQRIVHP